MPPTGRADSVGVDAGSTPNDRPVSVGVQADPAAEVGLVAHAVRPDELARPGGAALCGLPVAVLTMVPGMTWSQVHPRGWCSSCGWALVR